MNIKCEYCGAFFDDKANFCPHCGAVNNNIHRFANKTPKTIEELEEWYKAHNLPPYETTRFFIGVDYKKPRAFGIYRDGSEFVVYKNKDNGQRAVRYRGSDEAYAVNELYLKLKSEILNQKERNAANRSGSGRPASNASYIQRTKNSILSSIKGLGVIMYGFFGIGLFALAWWAGALIVAAAVGFFLLSSFKPDLYKKIKKFFWPIMIAVMIVAAILVGKYTTPVYYNYQGQTICEYQNEYYLYDSFTGDYYPAYNSLDYTGFVADPDAYKTEWDDSITDFEDSGYYGEHFDTGDSSSSSRSSDSSWSSWDSDSSWDSSDSWDSGSTDWGSDW